MTSLQTSQLAIRRPAAVRAHLAVFGEAVGQLRAAAAALGVSLRLMGGLPRDIALLQTGAAVTGPAAELDILVNANAPAVGRYLQAQWSGELTVHARFQTATWRRETRGVSVDLITARTESYPRPGALPEIRPGTWEEDVARRDFTINTLALELDAFPALMRGASHVWCHHHPLARSDLEAGRIRVLHPLSFQDDPTRIFRAVRYERRLGFHLEADTAARLRRTAARGGLDPLTPDRLRREYERIFREPRSVAMMERLTELDLWRHSGLRLDAPAPALAACARIPASADGRVELHWILLMARCVNLEHALEARLRLARPVVNAIHQFRDEVDRSEMAHLDSRPPSAVARRLDALDVRVVQALGYWHPHLGAVLDRYLSEWRALKPRLGGRDLMALGYAAGPQFHQVLRQLRAARLDGHLRSREEERAFVTRVLGPAPGSKAPA